MIELESTTLWRSISLTVAMAYPAAQSDPFMEHQGMIIRHAANSLSVA